MRQRIMFLTSQWLRVPAHSCASATVCKYAAKEMCGLRTRPLADADPHICWVCRLTEYTNQRTDWQRIFAGRNFADQNWPGSCSLISILFSNFSFFIFSCYSIFKIRFSIFSSYYSNFSFPSFICYLLYRIFGMI